MTIIEPNVPFSREAHGCDTALIGVFPYFCSEDLAGEKMRKKQASRHMPSSPLVSKQKCSSMIEWHKECLTSSRNRSQTDRKIVQSESFPVWR